MFDPVYMACDTSNVDAATAVCTAPYWVGQPSFLPSLTVSDGVVIGFAILALWAVAFMARALRVGGSR